MVIPWNAYSTVVLEYAFHGITMYGCAYGVSASTDNGATWTLVGTGYTGVSGAAIVVALAADAQGTLYGAVMGKGLFTLAANSAVRSSVSKAPRAKAGRPTLVLIERKALKNPAYINLRGSRSSGSTGLVIKGIE